MSDYKTIKGQAWINKEGDTVSLVQDIIKIYPGVVDGYDDTEVLVADIWEDLLSGSGTYLSNPGKNYFYWEYKMTDSLDDEREITIKFECPKPDDTIFEKLKEMHDNDELQGDYATYWYEKYETAVNNYEKQIAVQKKEFTFTGSSYYDPSTGELVTVDDMVVKNSDIGDISNLLSNLF